MPPTKTTWILSFALLVILPQSSLARTGSATIGLSTSYDYQDRKYDAYTDATGTRIEEITEKTEQWGLTPMISLVSEGQADSIELRLAPTLQYDLRDSDTDWDADIALIGEKTLSQFWRISGSNTFLRSDYHSPDFLELTPPDAPPVPSADLPTSPDLQRERYWQNSLIGDAFYTYGTEREAGIGFDWTVLRQDDETVGGAEDYDRYALRLENEYRFNPFWKNFLRLAVIRGDYSPADDDTDTVSFDGDLWEYRGGIGVENNSFNLNQYLLDYDYIGARYDETAADDTTVEDVDIHALTLTWQRDISPQWSVGLGGGPTYVRRDVRDDQWGGNGLAEINYFGRYTSYGLVLEKGYDVDGFSGADEIGLVDYTRATLSASHQLLEFLSLNGALIYSQDIRDLPLTEIDEEDGDVDDYTEDYFAASAGLIYSFLRDYNLGLQYTYSVLDSDLAGADYDDHRILLTLSWEREWLRW